MKNLLILLLGITIVSCGPKYYTPNTQNVPLITEKGETNISFLLNASEGNVGGTELQGAYGLTSNIALQSNLAYFENNYDRYCEACGKGRIFDLGAGYYKSLNRNYVFELYGIFSLGSVENRFNIRRTDFNPNPARGTLKANFSKRGLQFNFGFKSKNISFAFSNRISRLSFYNIKGDLRYDGVDQVSYLESNSSNIIFEPALTLKAGFKNIKLQAQIGRSNNGAFNQFRQTNRYMSLGLTSSF